VREQAVGEADEERGISTFVADLGRRGEGCVAATTTWSIVHCAVSPALATAD